MKSIISTILIGIIMPMLFSFPLYAGTPLRETEDVLKSNNKETTIEDIKELKQNCIKSVINSIIIDIANNKVELKTYEDRAEENRISEYKEKISELQKELEKYKNLKLEDYIIPEKKTVIITDCSGLRLNQILYVDKQNPWYYIASIKKGIEYPNPNYDYLRGLDYLTTIYLVREKPHHKMPSWYIYIDQMIRIEKSFDSLFNKYLKSFKIYNIATSTINSEEQGRHYTIAVGLNNELTYLEKYEDFCSFLEKHAPQVKNDKNILEIALLYCKLKDIKILNSNKELKNASFKPRKEEKDIKPPVVNKENGNYKIIFYALDDPNIIKIGKYILTITRDGKIGIKRVHISNRAGYL